MAYTLTDQTQFIQDDLEGAPSISSGLIRCFIALVFALATIGLWLAPGSNWSAEIMLLKTGLTSVLVFIVLAAVLPRR